MICRNCKNQVPDKAMFCTHCGYFLNGQGKPNPPAEEPKTEPETNNQPQQPSAQPETAAAPASAPASERSMSGAAVTGFVFALVALIFNFIPFIGTIFAYIFALVAFILGIVGLATTGPNKNRGLGFAIVAFVLSLLCFFLPVLMCAGLFALAI